jgi:hypothetical protein
MKWWISNKINSLFNYIIVSRKRKRKAVQIRDPKREALMSTETGFTCFVTNFAPGHLGRSWRQSDFKGKGRHWATQRGWSQTGLRFDMPQVRYQIDLESDRLGIR